MRISLLATDRECGGCTACCTALALEVLNKPEYTRCVHEGPHECTIYADRPDTCRAYRCLWHQGWLDDEFRPDRWGLVLDPFPTSAGLRLRVWEVEPGRWDEPGRAWQVRKIAEKLQCPGVVLYRHGVRSATIGAGMIAEPAGPDLPWLAIARPQ